MQSPDAAIAELVRVVRGLGFVGALVNGTTEGRFLDHPSYDGLLAAAVELDVPIYVHPHLAPEAVRQAYFADLPPGASRVLAGGYGALIDFLVAECCREGIAIRLGSAVTAIETMDGGSVLVRVRLR
jgi:phytoene dehydrogenase-like protein